MGVTGLGGQNIAVDATVPLTEAVIAAVEAGGVRFGIAVTNDDRADHSVPTALSGDMTGHLVIWNPSSGLWTDLGPWLGATGGTGARGPRGASMPSFGPTGPTGLGYPGPQGMTGPQQPTGPQVAFPGSEFGPGTDGNVTIVLSTSLTKDMFYDNLTLGSGVVLRTSGFRIFVRNTMMMTDLTTALDNSGNDGGNAQFTTAPVGGGAGASSATFLGGGAGGNGSNDSLNQTGNPSPDALFRVGETGSYYAGGNARNVVTAFSTAGGGANGPAIPLSQAMAVDMVDAALWPVKYPVPIQISGGAGGGSGFSGNPTVSAAGGGGGGGVISVAAGRILGAGTFRVVGGNSGRNLTTQDASGGGGGGGVVLLHTAVPIILANFNFQLNGGAPQNVVQAGGLPPNLPEASGLTGQLIIV
jgi:hypothetical protein